MVTTYPDTISSDTTGVRDEKISTDGTGSFSPDVFLKSRDDINLHSDWPRILPGGFFDSGYNPIEVFITGVKFSFWNSPMFNPDFDDIDYKIQKAIDHISTLVAVGEGRIKLVTQPESNAWPDEDQPDGPSISIKFAGDSQLGVTFVQDFHAKIEIDEDGSYVISDDIFFVYGTGDEIKEAIDDYLISVQEYVEIIFSDPDRNPQTERLAARIKEYIRLN